MYIALGILIGIMIMSVFWKIADNTSKKAGDECCYNCDDCTAHCVGYHCHVERWKLEKELAKDVTQDDDPGAGSCS